MSLGKKYSSNLLTITSLKVAGVENNDEKFPAPIDNVACVQTSPISSASHGKGTLFWVKQRIRRHLHVG